MTVAQEVGAFLAVCRTAALSTVGADGSPYAANVQFVADAGWRLWWLSSPGSRHSQDVAARPEVSACVYGHDDRAVQIHGVQMTGRADEVAMGSAEGAAALARYRAKLDDAVSAVSDFDAVLARMRLYRLTPGWVRWIDNRKGFGWKVELRPPGA
ncbi:MAG: pyridoxamine 5'-phosphate oxidase family protein [Planctomycetota bacterium]